MGVYLILAIRNLVQARRRTLLIGSALGLVTALFVILLSLSQGMTDTMMRVATTLSAGHVNVAGFYKQSAREAAPMVTGAAAVRKIVEEKTPGLDYVIDRQRGWAKIVSDTTSLYAGLTGVTIAEEGRLLAELQITAGDPQQLTGNDTCMIFEAQAERLQVGVGDLLTIASQDTSGRSNSADVRVVAIAADLGFMSNWSFFVPKETIYELYDMNRETTGVIQVYLKDAEQASATMGTLRTALSEAGYELMDHQPLPFWAKFERVSGEDWRGQRLDLTTWDDEVSFLKWVVTALDTISVVLIVILLGIIIVGIMNTMWISVRERTREIGTLRAIGMHRRRVLMMFLIEALLLGLAGTLAGALAGALLGVVVDLAAIKVPWPALKAVLMSDQIHLVVGFAQVAGAVLVFTLVTGLAALWPALRAAKLRPITAIQRVG
ncbi:MAG: FtsX-like permease family protein [Deltaproteobacteria bacterium]|nr:FtsX-like permease family protein [Deltaproteobacteria bacterium]